MSSRTLILNATQVGQRIDRLAWQIYEHCSDEKQIIVAGIASSGYELAKRICKVLEAVSPIKTELIEVKLDKEDPLKKPVVTGLSSDDLSQKTVIVVDDVSNSGRTLMYGVKHFLDSQVKAVLTVVLVDRDHNRFPVKTNFVGLSLATTLQEHISVELNPAGNDAVYLD